MKAADIRCEKDLAFAEKLLETREVKKVNQWLETRSAEQKQNSLRRHLLSTSVRVSPKISPRLHELAEHCRDKLGLTLPLEIYAYANPQFNAACFKPENGRLYVMFTSALLEAFDDTELCYVMGHEIGHHIYNHHQIPIGYLLKGKRPPPADLALQLFAWSRYAEFSADRAGAWCADDLDGVARALFKLASGITGLSEAGRFKFDLQAFLSQVDDMVTVQQEPGEGAPAQDWFSTHPFSPLRVKALSKFFESEFMQEKGIAKSDLELAITDIMQLMEPGYLEAQSDDATAMRRLFIAAAVIIAQLGGGISEAETAVLKQFLGKDQDLERLNLEQLEKVLPQRIDAVVEKASLSQRMQLIRDLSLIATADDQARQDKQTRLQNIAQDLQVDSSFLEACLALDHELD